MRPWGPRTISPVRTSYRARCHGHSSVPSRTWPWPSLANWWRQTFDTAKGWPSASPTARVPCAARLHLDDAVGPLDGREVHEPVALGDDGVLGRDLGERVHTGRLPAATSAPSPESRQAADARVRPTSHLRVVDVTQAASAGREAAPMSAATAITTLIDIERESRRQPPMSEIRRRRTLPEPFAPFVPLPSLTQLALLLRTKDRGSSLKVLGAPRPLAARVEVCAFRVVEELLDAVNDAPGVAVELEFLDDLLEIRVAGPARDPAEVEQAVSRARARARAAGGVLWTSSRPGRLEAVAQLGGVGA